MRRIKKPEGTLWPEEVHEKYHAAIGTLAQWRYYRIGPTPIRVGKKLVCYEKEECEEFFKKSKFKPRNKSRYVNAYRKNNQHQKPYKPSLKYKYMVMDTVQIAKELNIPQSKVSYILKRAQERFKKHWVWFRCLVRHGLTPDEAIIFLLYPHGIDGKVSHVKKKSDIKITDPVKNGFRERRLHELLDPLLINKDYQIACIDSALDYEHRVYLDQKGPWKRVLTHGGFILDQYIKGS